MSIKSKPVLSLSGEDGNAFSILGRAVRILKKENFSEEEIERFQTEATSGDYDNLLQTCMKWFDVQ